MKTIQKICIAAALLFASVTAAQASVTYVGSWNVNQGPAWAGSPLAYSGVGAAELLFGAGTYEISTVGPNVGDINNEAWYNVIGIGAEKFGESYFRGVEGVTHYRDVYVFNNAIDTVSAYVHDFGDNYTVNYAFRVSGVEVPEPATLALFALGLFGFAALRRSKQ